MNTATLAIAGTIVGGGLYPAIGTAISSLGYFAPLAVIAAGCISMLEATSLGALMGTYTKSVSLGEVIVSSTRSEPFAAAQALAAVVQFALAATYVAFILGKIASSMTIEYILPSGTEWLFTAFWSCFAILSLWGLSQYPKLSQHLRAIMATMELCTIGLFVFALVICNFIKEGPVVTAVEVEAPSSVTFSNVVTALLEMAFAFGGIAASVNELATQRDSLRGNQYITCAVSGVLLVMVVYSVACYFLVHVMQPHDLHSIQENHIKAVPNIIAMALSVLWDKAMGNRVAFSLSRKYAAASILTNMLMISSMYNTVGGAFETAVREMSGAAKRGWIAKYFDGAEEDARKSGVIAAALCIVLICCCPPDAWFSARYLVGLTSLCIFVTSAFTHVAALRLPAAPRWIYCCSAGGLACAALLTICVISLPDSLQPIIFALVVYGAMAGWVAWSMHKRAKQE